MPKCPRCHSTNIYRSRSQDSQVYRLLLAARVRCHSCSTCFFAWLWSVKPSRSSA